MKISELIGISNPANCKDMQKYLLETSADEIAADIEHLFDAHGKHENTRWFCCALSCEAMDCKEIPKLIQARNKLSPKAHELFSDYLILFVSQEFLKDFENKS